MLNKIYIKKDGVVTEEPGSAELWKKIKQDRGHKCWENCDNATVSRCQKIADDLKHNIAEYDFVTDGYQAFDEKGDLISFYVENCTNYKKAVPRKFTPEEAARIKLIKEDLRKAFFGTDTLAQSYATQYTQMRDGRISNVRGKTLADYLLSFLSFEMHDIGCKDLFNATDEELEIIVSSINKSMAYYAGNKEFIKNGELLKANLIMLAVNSSVGSLGFKTLDTVSADRVENIINKINRYLFPYCHNEYMFDSLDTVKIAYSMSKQLVDEDRFGYSPGK